MNKLEIPGRPVPKSYGLSKGKMYPQSKTQAQEEKISTLWANEFGRFQWMDGEFLAFSLRAYVKDKRYGDLKNYIYLAEDALTGIAYGDDKQIIMYDPECFISFCDEDEQRTVITVREIESAGIK